MSTLLHVCRHHSTAWLSGSQPGPQQALTGAALDFLTEGTTIRVEDRTETYVIYVYAVNPK
jgi:hypothetical protein